MTKVFQITIGTKELIVSTSSDTNNLLSNLIKLFSKVDAYTELDSDTDGNMIDLLHIYESRFLFSKSVDLRDFFDTYTLSITFGHFGSLEDVYKTLSKANRVIDVEEIEFKGNYGDDVEFLDEQHNTGILIEEFKLDSFENVQDFMGDYISSNSFQGECFAIKVNDVIILEEDDI